jgi:hypothetical protein
MQNAHFRMTFIFDARRQGGIQQRQQRCAIVRKRLDGDSVT